MIDIMKKIIENVLTALYQPFGFSVIMAILSMFLYMSTQEHGIKVLIQKWMHEFKTSGRFRGIFVMVFYIALILFRTLLNRDMWKNPIYNVIGIWGLYNENGELTTEAIENLVLFIPFTVLLLWNFREQLLDETVKILMTIWQSVKIVFLFSLAIEFLQLILRVGAFQLSDLFYNTLGGLIGGSIYWIGYKVLHRDRM